MNDSLFGGRGQKIARQRGEKWKSEIVEVRHLLAPRPAHLVRRFLTLISHQTPRNLIQATNKQLLSLLSSCQRRVFYVWKRVIRDGNAHIRFPKMDLMMVLQLTSLFI